MKYVIKKTENTTTPSLGNFLMCVLFYSTFRFPVILFAQG